MRPLISLISQLAGYALIFVVDWRVAFGVWLIHHFAINLEKQDKA